MPTALELARTLRERFGDAVAPPVEFRGEVTLTVADPERIAEVCSVAKRELGFDLLVDLTGVDNEGHGPRWAWSTRWLASGIGATSGSKPRWARSGPSCLPFPPCGGPRCGTSARRTTCWESGFGGIRTYAGSSCGRGTRSPLRKDFPLEGKSSEVPGVAFTRPAPLEGGPFVTVAGGADTIAREPRARGPGKQ